MLARTHELPDFLFFFLLIFQSNKRELEDFLPSSVSMTSCGKSLLSVYVFIIEKVSPFFPLEYFLAWCRFFKGMKQYISQKIGSF